MPIKQQNGDWYWGSKGPFDTKAKAEQVQQAAYASGYKGAIQKFAVFQKERRYEKNEVEYAPATEGQVKRGQQCSTCYFFQLEEQACLIVEGKMVVEDGRLLSISSKDIINKAKQSLKELMDKH